MPDLLITMGLLLLIAFILTFRSEYHPEGNTEFFGMNASRAMRGFWCLVVILTHTPEGYQNRLQDMVGSFGYIGVTFFFMTSAFGLTLGLKKKPEAIRTFWRSRLPKLIVPNWTINVVVILLYALFFRISHEFSVFFHIDPWVMWLLGCYAIFWLCRRFLPERFSNPVICLSVLAVSAAVYVLLHIVLETPGGWCTEVLGFVWGILLAEHYDRIKSFFTRNWLKKAILSCLISLVLGVLYLKCKPFVFWGGYVLKIILGISILIFILILNSRIKLGNPVISFLGEISFEVYLTHPDVFYFVETLLPDLDSGVFIVVSMITTVLFAAMVHKLSLMLLKRLHF